MNPMEKKKLAGYIFILITIGFFAGSLILSFLTNRMLSSQLIVPSDIPDKISRSILLVGLTIALFNLSIGLFLIIKYRDA
ncbi:MAG: hypothetical protein ACFFE5_11825 [Candidatus Thorarchaeota archaeon]